MNTNRFKQHILNQLKESYAEQGLILSDFELENKVNCLSKIEIMDRYFQQDNNLSAEKIIHFVRNIFGIDLDKAYVLNSAILEAIQQPSPKVAIDFTIETQKKSLSGEEIRLMLNTIFGVNLNGIASLEGKRISLHSKGQWIVRGENDLLIVYTGKNDLDVKVEVSDYFKEKTDLNEMPQNLKQTLEEIGFTYQETFCYYATPDKKPVPDSFKGRTLGLLMKFIQEEYNNL